VTKQLYQRGIREVVNPLDALMNLVSETVAFKELLEEQIAQMQSEDWRYQSKLGAEQLDSRIALYERSLDRAGKLLTDVARLGLEAKALKLEEDKVRLVLAALDAALAGQENADMVRQAFIRRLRSA